MSRPAHTPPDRKDQGAEDKNKVIAVAGSAPEKDALPLGDVEHKFGPTAKGRTNILKLNVHVEIQSSGGASTSGASTSATPETRRAINLPHPPLENEKWRSDITSEAWDASMFGIHGQGLHGIHGMGGGDKHKRTRSG